MRQDGTTKEYRVLARHRGGDQLAQRVLPTGFPSSTGYQSTTEDLELATRYAADLESMDSIEEVRVEAREVGPWEPVGAGEERPLVVGDPDVSKAGSRIITW